MFVEDCQIARDANYTLSLIPLLERIDKELGTGNLSTYCLTDHNERTSAKTKSVPKVNWKRCVSEVLPENLKYIVQSKQYELEKKELIRQYLSLPYGNSRRLQLEMKLKKLKWI